jgi:hypothetical protein
MSDNSNYKEIMINYSLIIIVSLFLVVYFVINYDIVQEGNIYGGNIAKSIMITGAIFLILYIFLTWEDEEIEEEMIIIPKYKINNNIEINDNSPNNTKANLKIENKYNTKYTKENLTNNDDLMNRENLVIEKQDISDNKLSNSNIFVTQKNKAKFGIKF